MRWKNLSKERSRMAGRSTRLTLELSERAAAALEELAKGAGRSPAEILGEGLVLRKLAASVEAQQRRLAIVGSDGTVHERIVVA